MWSGSLLKRDSSPCLLQSRLESRNPRVPQCFYAALTNLPGQLIMERSAETYSYFVKHVKILVHTQYR